MEGSVRCIDKKELFQIPSYKRKIALLIIFLPSLFVTGLHYLTSCLSGLNSSPQTVKLTRCTAFDLTSLPYTPSSPCITVAFAPNSPAEADDVRDIMTRIAASTGLSISSGPSVAGDIVEFPDKFKLAEWAFDHAQQQVDAAVILSIAPGGRASYELWVNSSLPALYSSSGLDSIWRYSGYSGRLLGLQKELDAGIIGHALGELGVSQTEEGARAFLNHHRRLELLHPFQNEPQGSEKVESPLLAASFSLDSTIAPFEQVDPLSGGVLLEEW